MTKDTRAGYLLFNRASQITTIMRVQLRILIVNIMPIAVLIVLTGHITKVVTHGTRPSPFAHYLRVN